jgi:hypothetical protein
MTTISKPEDTIGWGRGVVTLSSENPLAGRECQRCGLKFYPGHVVLIKVDCLVRHVDCSG